MTLTEFLSRVSRYIVSPIIVLLIALAVVIFIWGVVQYIRGADDEKERTLGAQHMLWGVVGIFIMVAVYGFINFIQTTVIELLF